MTRIDFVRIALDTGDRRRHELLEIPFSRIQEPVVLGKAGGLADPRIGYQPLLQQNSAGSSRPIDSDAICRVAASPLRLEGFLDALEEGNDVVLDDRLARIEIDGKVDRTVGGLE